MIVGEFLKLSASCLLEASLCKGDVWKRLRQHTYENPYEMLKMAIPASLYLISNSLLYLAISHLSVPVFQFSNQFKLMITAVMSVIMLGKKYSASQWSDLVIITLCIACVMWEDSKGEGKKTENLIVGVGAVALSNILSSFAGVFFEKVIKSENSTKQPSLWVRNFQLAFWSLLFVVLKEWLLDTGSILHTGTFFRGFDVLVWCQIGLFSVGGLLVAAVIKHADSVVKSIATGLSVMLSTIGSMILYKKPISLPAFISGFVAIVSMFLFANRGEVRTEAISLIALFHRTKSRNFLFSSFILTMISVQFTISSLRPPVVHNTTAIQPTAELNKDIFPRDWNTTVLALHTLRSVQVEVPERKFHEATHVLFDLRSHFGHRPVKYLEIGSYTGVSASLMLRHPFETSVTMVDPCILDKSHFEGSRSQEDTIRRNIKKLLNMAGKCASIRSWELRVGFSPQALPSGESFDIIFIDGDHSSRGVWADYNGTVDMLRPGGFMVFDDYLDFVFSREVRGAVDNIAKATDLIPLGTLRNIHGIHPHANRSFINEFILQKPGKFEYSALGTIQMQPSDPLLCIAVGTLYQSNRLSLGGLEKLWKMLESQSHKNWELYLIVYGCDSFEELQGLSFFNDKRAHLKNVVALVDEGSHGVINQAIDQIIGDGKEWLVLLDENDHWDSDHLANIATGFRTGSSFVFTHCQLLGKLVPDVAENSTSISHGILPKPCNVVHSSVGFNVLKILTRYVRHPDFVLDDFLWSRIIFDDGFFPAFVPVRSCHRVVQEGSNPWKIVGRKSMLHGKEAPPGWSAEDNDGPYYAVATDNFPNSVPAECRYIIGPKRNPSDSESFTRLPPEEVPYFIRSVSAFSNLPVW
eukprot:CAMPEP_0113616672 /NCGR_PEP_ID=MMETSP0017_2-20120614/8364_1 /TAXON_ID=2856 /ORGANISM="Cylindrotheca closterium" /LENGTH=864 /DNA_ID=CAMNT_0000526001 /DNA_START=208 /DNA_END=2799 /DNA_ORIENTATION=- /assembly_acc=CAM_ASM_000147